MGSLSKLIKEKGGEPGVGRAEQVRVQQIHYTKLKESGLNFYTRSEDEVAELADTMLIAGGILQPLIVRKTDLSEYEILAGHKRRRASIYNVGRGYREYEFLPCIVIDMGGLMAKKISERILAGQDDIADEKMLDMIAEYIVICTNSTASESSHYEKMMQAVRLSKILPAMLDNEGLKGRALRAEIAKEMKCGDGQVGRYQGIYNNLVPEAMERFKDGKINLSVASSLSGLDKDQQLEALKRQQITTADIEALKQDKNTEAVSNLDTKEVYGTEFLNQEDDSGAVSNLDTNNTDIPAAESLSDEGYEKTEATKENIYHAFQLVFDDENSGFPCEVKEELLSFMENMGGHVSVLTDIFDKALPFDNSRIRIENICGYTVCFKEKNLKMRVALWPFWNAFISKYHYHEGMPPAEGQAAGDRDPAQAAGDGEENRPAAVDKENEGTAASGRAETVQPYSLGYTLEEARQVYDGQVERMRQIERIREYGGLSDGDERQYKEAKIIRDGVAYILEAFKEGAIC